MERWPQHPVAEFADQLRPRVSSRGDLISSADRKQTLDSLGYWNSPLVVALRF